MMEHLVSREVAAGSMRVASPVAQAGALKRWPWDWTAAVVPLVDWSCPRWPSISLAKSHPPNTGWVLLHSTQLIFSYWRMATVSDLFIYGFPVTGIVQAGIPKAPKTDCWKHVYMYTYSRYTYIHYHFHFRYHYHYMAFHCITYVHTYICYITFTFACTFTIFYHYHNHYHFHYHTLHYINMYNKITIIILITVIIIT